MKTPRNARPAGNATLQRGSDAGLEASVPRWHSRGYLPHFESAEVIQHVTYRLADSLPADVLARFEDELRAMPPERRDTERRKRIEAWLDAGHGCCVLREPAVADMVQSSFLRFDGERYRLFAWVVMPNHVHVLFQPLAGWTMAKIVASWKSFTGRRIAEYMDQVGWGGLGWGGLGWGGQAGAWRSQGERRVWQREYWDRFMRNERHFRTAVAYIHNNPVKAGLVERAEDWPWSSASARLQPGGPRPEHGGPRPEHGGPRPEHGGPRPERDGPRPEHGGPRLEPGGPRPEHGGPRPERDGPRPERDGPGEVRP